MLYRPCYTGYCYTRGASQVLLAPPRQHKQRPRTGPRSLASHKSIPHFSHGAGADRSPIPITLQQGAFDDRPHFAPQPLLKGQRKATLRAIHDPAGQLDAQAREQQSLGHVPSQLFYPWSAEADFDQRPVEKGHAQLETVRHAHEIRVPEQSVAHVEMRFEIGNAVDGIEKLTRGD